MGGAVMDVIGVAGSLAAGKSTFIRTIEQEIPVQIISFGRFVKGQAQTRGLAIARKTLQDLGEELVTTWGPEAFVDKVLSEQLQSAPTLVVLDGVRHVSVWGAVCNRFGRAILVYLSQSEKLSTDRLMGRDGLTVEVAQEAIQHPMEAGLSAVEAVADVVLRGDQGIDFIKYILTRPRTPVPGG
jgi:dephospho-CoA kinase